MVGESDGGLLAASPGRAVEPSPFLVAFRRIDAVDLQFLPKECGQARCLVPAFGGAD
jgi:hypothetical protein